MQASKKEESFSTQLRTLTAKCKEVSNQHHSSAQTLTERKVKNTDATTERLVVDLMIVHHLSPHLFLTSVLALTVT